MPTRVRPNPDHNAPKPPQPQQPPKAEPPVTSPATLPSYGNASIDSWDEGFIRASDAVKAKKGVRVDPLFLKGMMDVESGGNGKLAPGWCRSDGSCGPMQIKPQYHQQRCPECDFSTVPGQIELAAHIIGDTMLTEGGDEYGALTSVYFPTDDVLNGTTQGQYVTRVKNLVAIMKGAGTTPAPKPKPVTEKEALALIAGPTAYVGFGFNQPNMSCGNSGREPCHFYTYGINHGTSADYMHTGDDVIVPRGTTVRTPFAGRVVCVGEQGEVVWGEGCGSFTDTSGGVGNVTVLTDAGLKIVFGHCSAALVNYGERVTAGQPVARSGTNRSDHLHLDVTTNRNGAYWLVDPLPAIAAKMIGSPLPTVYPTAYDVAQPDELTTFATVKVIAERVPVLQRAHRDAAKVAPDILKGDTFESAQKQLGDDGAWYWIGRYLKGRVPVIGTEEVVR